MAAIPGIFRLIIHKRLSTLLNRWYCDYNRCMRIAQRHSWQVTARQAKEIQLKLAAKISREGEVENPHLIAGVDLSVSRYRKTGTAAVVVLGYPALNLVETQTAAGAITFPYVPGLLSFREIPLILQAFRQLKSVPDVVIVDGQGIAHPRRIGIASHLGLFLNIPTIGCAKSRLIGEYKEPEASRGSWGMLSDKNEVIGAVVRTREAVKPVYVSTGHMIELKSAVSWVLACCRGYRLPEPTRLAHQAAGGKLTENIYYPDK